MRQRLGVAGALLGGDPDLLILDDPTTGLISSRLLSEVQQICKRVVVLDQDAVVAEDTAEDLLTKAGSASVVVDARPAPPRENTTDEKPPVWSVRVCRSGCRYGRPTVVCLVVAAAGEAAAVREEHRR
ncbi:hypothetical protein [Herbidospora sp. NBRC 101105]|uniref:hypothetical protein n=1 Tax=Herbidospora sp. NBRC 101105 TaxID=3032195 RepID=UPI0024A36CD2|nr:hypothetical protein [Herbidospora sp. NBRC 101105]GLX99595.1 hypothetical protein Hesp01_75450 [Herbidospora sp. NBRC 101105]